MSEIRPHFRKAVRDGSGNLRVGASVTLCEPGTADPIPEPVYSAPTGEATRGSSWVATTGIIDFYLDDPRVVDIRVVPAGDVAVATFYNQWVGDVENLHPDGLSASGALAGQAPVAAGDGTWEWGPVGGGVTSVNGDSGPIVLTAESLGAVPATTEITAVEVLSVAEHAALTEKDPTTVYFITAGVAG